MAGDERRPGAGPRRPRLRLFPVALVVTLVAAAAVVTPGVRLYIEQDRQRAELQQQVDQQREQLDALQQERARWDDPAYIRAQARQRLYFVVPGETTYVVVGADGQPTDAQDAMPSAEATSSDSRWEDVLGASIVSAGTGDAPLGADDEQLGGDGSGQGADASAGQPEQGGADGQGDQPDQSDGDEG